MTKAYQQSTIHFYKNSNTPTFLKTVILTYLELILTINDFIFNGELNLRIKGCAIGMKCAPSYANLSMDNFETKFIYPTRTRRQKTKVYPASDKNLAFLLAKTRYVSTAYSPVCSRNLKLHYNGILKTFENI